MAVFVFVFASALTCFPTNNQSLAISQRPRFRVGTSALPFRVSTQISTARRRARARMYPAQNPQMVPPSGLVTGMPLPSLVVCPMCRVTVQPPFGAPVVACGVCRATMQVAPAFPPPPTVVHRSRSSGSCFWMPCLIVLTCLSDAGDMLLRGVGAVAGAAFCCCLGLGEM